MLVEHKIRYACMHPFELYRKMYTPHEYKRDFLRPAPKNNPCLSVSICDSKGV